MSHDQEKIAGMSRKNDGAPITYDEMMRRLNLTARERAEIAAETARLLKEERRAKRKKSRRARRK